VVRKKVLQASRYAKHFQISCRQCFIQQPRASLRLALIVADAMVKYNPLCVVLSISIVIVIDGPLIQCTLDKEEEVPY